MAWYYNPKIHMSFMLNKNNLIKVVWIFYHVFPLTDHVGLHHTWVWRVFFLCRTWASTLEQLEDIARLLSLGIDVGALLVLHHFLLNVVLLLLQSSPACSSVFTNLESENICNISKENASNKNCSYMYSTEMLGSKCLARESSAPWLENSQSHLLAQLRQHLHLLQMHRSSCWQTSLQVSTKGIEE